MPGFSAITYFFLGIKRSPQDETFIKHLLSLKSPKDILGLVPGGLQMSQPIPIFSKVEDETVQLYRKQFGGKEGEDKDEH